MANSVETKVQVLIDKLQVLIGSGSFESLSSVDRKLMLQYVSQLRESLQVLIGSPDLSSARVEAGLEDTPRIETPPPVVTKPEEPVRGPAPQSNLPDEVLRELQEVKKSREQYEQVIGEKNGSDDRTKSVNTVAREKQQVTSLHERFAETGEDHLADQIKKVPLTSLRTGISLNDKIWFVKELFDGNNEAYDSAIRQLDAAPSSQAAMAICDTLTAAHNWSASHLSVTKFMGCVRRRFPQ